METTDLPAGSNQTVLALILARGGSKSIPGKNIALVAGKPLLAWSIEAARKASRVARVVISTDSLEIREIAVRYGAEAPFLRPAELARDETPSMAAVLHAVRWLEQHETYRADYILLLQPTSPLRRKEDIEGIINLVVSHGAPAALSVFPASQHPFWMKKINSAGEMESFLKLDREYERRQDLPPAYVLNGALYLVHREILLSQETFTPKGTLAYVMSGEHSLDVDSPWDLHLVDLILKDRITHEDL
ncbi:MAG: acylneuraminate cytidylyltransferase family protein [Planctomycetota bacterium]